MWREKIFEAQAADGIRSEGGLISFNGGVTRVYDCDVYFTDVFFLRLQPIFSLYIFAFEGRRCEPRRRFSDSIFCAVAIGSDMGCCTIGVFVSSMDESEGRVLVNVNFVGTCVSDPDDSGCRVESSMAVFPAVSVKVAFCSVSADWNVSVVSVEAEARFLGRLRAFSLSIAWRIWAVQRRRSGAAGTTPSKT